MTILIATTNPGKAKEFREMLGDDTSDWKMLTDLPAQPEVEETGRTFRANAMLKASAYAKSTRLWTIADDSGLEVDALNKNPGIFSARWAKMHNAGSGDQANNDLVLKQLEELEKSVPPGSEAFLKPGPGGQPARSARFVCVLALSDPNGRIMLTTRATMEGSIALAPVGSHGFGYDPLFVVTGLGRTSAELSPEEKHRVSHRGRALEQMKPLLALL